MLGDQLHRIQRLARSSGASSAKRYSDKAHWWLHTHLRASSGVSSAGTDYTKHKANVHLLFHRYSWGSFRRYCGKIDGLDSSVPEVLRRHIKREARRRKDSPVSMSTLSNSSSVSSAEGNAAYTIDPITLKKSRATAAKSVRKSVKVPTETVENEDPSQPFGQNFVKQHVCGCGSKSSATAAAASSSSASSHSYVATSASAHSSSAAATASSATSSAASSAFSSNFFRETDPQHPLYPTEPVVSLNATQFHAGSELTHEAHFASLATAPVAPKIHGPVILTDQNEQLIPNSASIGLSSEICSSPVACHQPHEGLESEDHKLPDPEHHEPISPSVFGPVVLNNHIVTEGQNASYGASEAMANEHVVSLELSDSKEDSCSKGTSFKVTSKADADSSSAKETPLNTANLMSGLKVHGKYRDKSEYFASLLNDKDHGFTARRSAIKTGSEVNPRPDFFGTILPEDVRQMYQSRPNVSAASATNLRSVISKKLSQNKNLSDINEKTALLEDVLKVAKEEEKQTDEELFRTANAYSFSREQSLFKNTRSIEQGNFFTPIHTEVLSSRKGLGVEYSIITPNLKVIRTKKDPREQGRLLHISSLSLDASSKTFNDPQRMLAKADKLLKRGFVPIGRKADGSIVFKKEYHKARRAAWKLVKFSVGTASLFVLTTIVIFADSSFVLL